MRPATLRRLTVLAHPITSRPITTSVIRQAAAATAASPSTSGNGSGIGLTPKKYTRKVASPAVGGTTATAARSARAATTAAPIKPASAPATNSDMAFDEAEADDYSIPDLSAGIDDYAALTAPSPSASAPIIARRARASSPAPSSDPFAALQPTPSPPMTALPPGPSTLPLIGSRQPDIQGELAIGPGTEADWSTSFSGLGQAAFPQEVGQALLRPLEPADVEVKPDGLLYLPEIKYRRTLNAAFGPGGWGLAPRGETNVGPRIVSREWGLVAMGRLVSVARGEQEYFDPSGIPTATEACKSNALMRCCKDLGIASELWDPRYIREFKAKYCVEVFTEHMGTKRKKKMWRKKDAKFEYPYKEG